MSWSEIESSSINKDDIEKRKKEFEAANIELCKKYARVFASEEGKVVYQDLFNRFIMNNQTPLESKNPNYEAAYHNGESGVIHYITSRMSQLKP